MEALVLTVVFFVLAGVGVGVWWFSADNVGKRRLRSLVTTPIADANEGALVKITGRLVLADQAELEGPLTGRRCVGYVVEVKERTQSGAKANWDKIIVKENAVAFVVEDATGKALVMASGAHLVLVRDGHVRSGSLSDRAERAEVFLKGHGTPSETVLRMKKSLCYEEGVLERGEDVSVLGVAAWEEVPAFMRSAGQQDIAKCLVLRPLPGGSLTISDDPLTI
jgi:hypothetical protein